MRNFDIVYNKFIRVNNFIKTILFMFILTFYLVLLVLTTSSHVNKSHTFICVLCIIFSIIFLKICYKYQEGMLQIISCLRVLSNKCSENINTREKINLINEFLNELSKFELYLYRKFFVGSVK